MKIRLQKLVIFFFSLFFSLILPILNILKVNSIISYARLGMWRVKKLTFGYNVVLRSHIIIRHPELVVIGNNVSINEFVHIWGGGKVVIGDGTMIASHCVITSQTHLIDGNSFRETLDCKPVVIGKNVWIGAGAIILPNVTIGDNSVIGAGSFVNKDVPGNTVVAGVPARVLRSVP